MEYCIATGLQETFKKLIFYLKFYNLYSSYKMTAQNIVLNNHDLVFYLSDFLDDTSSFKLFNTDKHYTYMIQKYPHRYTVKKIVSSNNNINYGYKIENFRQDENQPVNKLPPSLKHLVFGKSFNQPVDNLPPSLKYLTFEVRFNQPVDNLPPSLKHLEFGFCFNRHVDNLPPSLKHLTFGNDFNQPVDNLPPSLKHLAFGKSFNQPEDTYHHL